MARKKRRTCGIADCMEDPYIGGLCQTHHEEDQRNRLLQQHALEALFRGVVDGRLPDDPALRDELLRLGRKWYRACNAVNYGHETAAMPLDEAQYAVDWCVALAREIVLAERAIRAGRTPAQSLDGTRHWVWQRLDFLEAGLRSNGLPR